MKNTIAALTLGAMLASGTSGPARSQPSSLQSSISRSMSSPNISTFTQLLDASASMANSINQTLVGQQQATIDSIQAQAMATQQQAAAQLVSSSAAVAGATLSLVVSMGGAAAGMDASISESVAGARMNHAMSCPVFAGGGTVLGEDGCVWAKATGQHAIQFGVATDSAGIHAGGQREISPGWFLGGSLGVSSSWMNAGGASSLAQSFGGSVALKHVQGPWLLAGAVAASTTATHITRPSGGPPGSLMQGDANVFQGGVRLRAAYDVAFTGWYLRPRLDLDAYYRSLSGYQEYGAGAVALVVNGTSKVNAMIAPTLEVGGRLEMGEGIILRPYLAGGVVVLPDNTLTLDTSFAGPLAPFGGFRTTFQGPPVLGTVEAGVQVYREHGFEMKADYRLAAGQSLLSQSIALRGAWHF